MSPEVLALTRLITAKHTVIELVHLSLSEERQRTESGKLPVPSQKQTERSVYLGLFLLARAMAESLRCRNEGTLDRRSWAIFSASLVLGVLERLPLASHATSAYFYTTVMLH